MPPQRGFNTYATLAACKSAQQAMAKPHLGAGLRAGSNPSLRSAATRRSSHAAATFHAAQACPWPITPPTGDGVSRTNCPVRL